MPAKKHCAAQAEYRRLAAQAYSPSMQLPRQEFCLGATKKVQRHSGEFAGRFAR
jgi:hypothetical protein